MNAKHTAINNIINDFEQVSQLCLNQVSQLNTLVTDANADKESIYAKMRDNENIIDHFEINISEEIINTIVLYQPLAGELRKLISCMRIIGFIERISDLSINIIEFINRIDHLEHLLFFAGPMEEMLNMTYSMTQGAISSFACENEESARLTIERDDEVDDLQRMISAQILEKKIIDNISSNSQINSLICINNISSNIERIADNATNIAEASIYMLKGKDIRHS